MAWAQILFGFHGRIRRRAYWLGITASWAVWLALMTPTWIGFDPTPAPERGLFASEPLVIVNVLATTIAACWIALAVTVKRWHDRNKSGAWVLIALMPIVGPLWQLIECGLLDRAPGPNRFGPSPKAQEREAKRIPLVS